MKIAAVCPTYKRPQLLGRAIHCFLQQTYKNSELVILDDAGQYDNQAGERWRLVSVKDRYPNFGAKRNAVIGLISPDVDGILCWDDDDVYWPHAIESVVRALSERCWAQPRRVLESAGPRALKRSLAHGVGGGDIAYGGAWAWLVKAFRSIGGYGSINCGDDVWVASRLRKKYGASADSSKGVEPWYWYNRDPGHPHIINEGGDFWAKRGRLPSNFEGSVKIGWNGPDVYGFNVLPGVHKRFW